MYKQIHVLKIILFRIELNKKVGYTDARDAAVLKRHVNNEIRQKKSQDDYNEIQQKQIKWI